MRRYIFLLILFTILVYLNSFGNAFVWDDLNNIVNNESLKWPVAWNDVFFKLQPPARFYRPIPFLTITLDHLFWGKNPAGYHLTNLIFHLSNVVLAFFITLWLSKSRLISFTCAILFAIHPIHAEAITYISGRSDPVCGFFIFSAFLFYMKSLDTIGYRQLAYLGGSLFLFLLGLLSKEIAIILPFIILAYEHLYSNSHFKTCFKRVIPFFAVLAAFLAFRYICVGRFNSGIDLSRILLIPQTLLYYIMLLILPVNLHMQHRLEDSLLFVNMPVILSFLIFTGFILIILRFARERFMKFSLAFFLVGLLPFLGFIKLNADIAEHWLYIASFGFLLFISGLFARVKPLNRKIVLPAAILILSLLTLQRNTIWRDDVSIYKDTLKYRPDDPKIHYNLGNAYLRRGMFNEAIKEYSISIEQKPDYAYALNNLGIAMEGGGIAFAEETHFEHSLYGEVLAKFVDDGNVDYVTLRNNPALLNDYLRKTAELDPKELASMTRYERLAFYINVYNALTLKVIIDHYPVKSIKDIPGVWDKIKFKVAGSEFSLNQIEHEILRKEFKEPRIHFALVCASIGCPKLSNEPFNGIDMNKQLDRKAHNFINDKTKVRLDKDNKILYLSSIFKWFKEDFGDVVEFAGRHLPEDDVRFVKEKKPRIKYLDYDWSLNEK
ncbi:MAG: DUF547 domain-containing protein [Candidatus Omnitrophica bacterium]|nr:DUF547 domain-containing protein [Candidatus Omnitrophota bacterium]